MPRGAARGRRWYSQDTARPAQQCHLPSGAAAGQWLPSSFSVGRKNDRKGYSVYIPPYISFPHTTPQLDTHLVPKPASSSLRGQVRNAVHSQLHETLTIWQAWESSPAFLHPQCTRSASAGLLLREETTASVHQATAAVSSALQPEESEPEHGRGRGNTACVRHADVGE